MEAAGRDRCCTLERGKQCLCSACRSLTESSISVRPESPTKRRPTKVFFLLTCSQRLTNGSNEHQTFLTRWFWCRIRNRCFNTTNPHGWTKWFIFGCRICLDSTSFMKRWQKLTPKPGKPNFWKKVRIANRSTGPAVKDSGGEWHLKDRASDLPFYSAPSLTLAENLRLCPSTCSSGHTRRRALIHFLPGKICHCRVFLPGKFHLVQILEGLNRRNLFRILDKIQILLGQSWNSA